MSEIPILTTTFLDHFDKFDNIVEKNKKIDKLLFEKREWDGWDLFAFLGSKAAVVLSGAIVYSDGKRLVETFVREAREEQARKDQQRRFENILYASIFGLPYNPFTDELVLIPANFGRNN